MGQCNTVLEWCELAIYEIVSSALLSRDIFTGTKGAGTHLRLMQIRSRCFRSAHSGLRSRTVVCLSFSLSFSRLLSFLLSSSLVLPRHLRGLLAQVVSRGGLRRSLTSPFTSYATKHRESFVSTPGEYNKNIDIHREEN